jgi:hypothetical protein
MLVEHGACDSQEEAIAVATAIRGAAWLAAVCRIRDAAATAVLAHLANHAPKCRYVWTSRVGADLIRVAAYRTAAALNLDGANDSDRDDNADYRVVLQITAEIAS